MMRSIALQWIFGTSIVTSSSSVLENRMWERSCILRGP
jgi:hypothetical protein